MRPIGCKNFHMQTLEHKYPNFIENHENSLFPSRNVLFDGNQFMKDLLF